MFMKKLMYLILILSFLPVWGALSQQTNQTGQAQAPNYKSISAGTWTELASDNELTFSAQVGTCGQSNQLWFKAENKTAKEIHILASLSIENGMRAPMQILILKAQQILVFNCDKPQPFMIIPLMGNGNAKVSLEYQVNKRL
jgi:hypothetical protein